MDESGRETVDDVVSEPDLSSDEYVLNCLLVYCHLSQSIELLACLLALLSLDRIACLFTTTLYNCLLACLTST
jgi:hypothetical protein